MRIRASYVFVAGLALLAFILLAASYPASAQDIRQAEQKARLDREAALEEALQAEGRILADRELLMAEVLRLENEQADLEAELQALVVRQDEGRIELADLSRQWAGMELGFREISGNVRVAARDLESLLRASPLSAGADWRLKAVTPLLEKGYFPDIDDIAAMTTVFFDEIDRGSQVTLREGSFVGRDGLETTGEIFQLGKFISVYRSAGETGFLTWTPGGAHLFALSELPSRGVRRSLDRYLAGESESVPVDMSGGTTLRQLTHQAGLIDQLRAGGPIIWPILLIAVAALGIVVFKIVFLNRLHGNTDRVMGQVNELAAVGDWTGCDRIVGEHSGKNLPVIHVIRAGLGARDEDRETLESTLQEAILHELPRIQRGISILAVLGAVAPLLGLLGTVTGMIDTFRVITMFGTSDPKLMSGGISEALVTTELGLAVAIPIMLLHTWLSRRTDRLIGDMEEKAVQLTNIVQKQKLLPESGRGSGSGPANGFGKSVDG
ncbi:MAG: MotA/TolQ/ExbB proton channel family protein [Gemmatimonadales bacterium]|nr:MotA/TolQ/ExbB proton channel family protein [Gemmatimonadales bacterium]